MSSQLLWEVVKGNHSFLRKGINGTVFSAEPGNLYNLHTYKYSGIANSKTVDIAADGESVKLSKARVKLANAPAKAQHTITLKKHFRRIAKAASAEVGGYRPDLKKAALARLSAVHKSIRVMKSGQKKSKK